MARVNIIKQVKTPAGWKNISLDRDARGRIKWSSTQGRYLIEWRESGRRWRQAAGITPAEALEAQRRKKLELDAAQTGLHVAGLPEDESLPLKDSVENFLKDIKTFRKKLTHEKYRHILDLS